MKIGEVISVFGLFAVIVSGAPTTPSNQRHLQSQEVIFSKENVIYESKHDIVNIIVPTNGLNFHEGDDQFIIFFVEADIHNEIKDYKGLFMHDNKTATLVLANGRDAAVSNRHEKDKNVYFAADDGIYSYDAESRSAKKYGIFNKSCYAIAKSNVTDAIYVLTDEKDLYKVTNEGNDVQLVNAIEKAESIILDGLDNLYFYGPDRVPKVFDGQNIKSFTGIPSKPTNITLIRPVYFQPNCILSAIDSCGYLLCPNGTTQDVQYNLPHRPSAFGIEAGLIQYFGYERKIYAYNVLAQLLDSVFKKLGEGLKNGFKNIFN